MAQDRGEWDWILYGQCWFKVLINPQPDATAWEYAKTDFRAPSAEKECCSLLTPKNKLTEFIQALFHILFILKGTYLLDYMDHVLRRPFFLLNLRKAEGHKLRQLYTL